MVHHMILWKIKEEKTEEEKQQMKENVKKNLEGLVGVVDGLVKCNVIIDGLASSTCDIMLDSELESEEALKAYQKNPAHVHVADTFVRPFMQVRMCMDYED